MTLIVSVVLMLLMMVAFRQATINQGLEVLWRETIKKNPTSFIAYNNLGAFLNRRGNPSDVGTLLNLGVIAANEQQAR